MIFPSSTARAAAALALASTLACAARQPDTASAPAAPPGGAPGSATSTASAAVTAPRGDRWQILLNDGSYLYEIRLLAARGDTLVVAQPDDTLGVPLAAIDELRLVQASSKVAGNARNTYNSLTGVDDAVLKLGRYEPAERRGLIDALLRERAAADSSR